jgi:hypothetical protein
MIPPLSSHANGRIHLAENHLNREPRLRGVDGPQLLEAELIPLWRATRLGAAQQLVFTYLWLRAGLRPNTVETSRQQIAHALGKSEGSIRDCLPKLVERGIVQIYDDSGGALRLYVYDPIGLVSDRLVEPSPQLELPLADFAQDPEQNPAQRTRAVAQDSEQDPAHVIRFQPRPTRSFPGADAREGPQPAQDPEQNPAPPHEHGERKKYKSMIHEQGRGPALDPELQALAEIYDQRRRDLAVSPPREPLPVAEVLAATSRDRPAEFASRVAARAEKYRRAVNAGPTTNASIFRRAATHVEARRLSATAVDEVLAQMEKMRREKTPFQKGPGAYFLGSLKRLCANAGVEWKAIEGGNEPRPPPRG